MLQGKRILAVVPARSGSKGIPDKNLKQLCGISLIGWAGKTLAALPWIDVRLISTDSETYAAEACRWGLERLFLRPPRLSTDRAGAVETLQHALQEAEKQKASTFDVILIVEPTSPLRTAADIEAATRMLLETDADSVVTVSPAPTKFHPLKLLTVRDGRLGFYEEQGQRIRNRQELSGGLYWRNGFCYALTRACLADKGAIITDRTLALVTTRPVVNIDEPEELEWAEILMRKRLGPPDGPGGGHG